MIIVNYPSKKQLKTHIGQKLDYTETSMFGNEVKGIGKEVVTGSNRPSLNRLLPKGSREFFAQIHLEDGVITKVE